jgi:hypothetical protein
MMLTFNGVMAERYPNRVVNAAKISPRTNIAPAAMIHLACSCGSILNNAMNAGKAIRPPPLRAKTALIAASAI